MDYFDSKTEVILSTFTCMETSLFTLGDHMVHLEQRVATNEDNVSNLSTRVQQLEKDNSYLLEKVEDLENRSSSSNLHFLRVPEAAEGRDIPGFMAHLIPQLLGPDNFSTPLPIERAHRTPTFRRDDSSRPRTILIKLQHFQDKVKILRLARGKKELCYKGTRIFVYPDFSTDLTKRRRAFNQMFKMPGTCFTLKLRRS